MTSSRPVPPLAPDELVSTGQERQVLEAFLDLYRDILKRTLGGLIKHLAAVEQEWFQGVLAGRSEDELGTPAPDDGWTLSSDDTAESLLAGYERACAASRQVAAGFSLEDRVPHPRLGQVSLRWIY